MHAIVNRIEKILYEHTPTLRNIPEEVFAAKPLPGKWSKKEILGHLIDSAQSNIRRFIVAQYEEMPVIVYNQDKWVAASAYQLWKTADIIDLWYLLNKQVCAVLEAIPPGQEQRMCQTQSQHTIAWLAEDYGKHLLHHLHVVLDLEPVNYP